MEVADKVCGRCGNYMRHVVIVFNERELISQTVVFSGERSEAIDKIIKEGLPLDVLEDVSYCDVDEERCPYILERLVLREGGFDGKATKKHNGER